MRAYYTHTGFVVKCDGILLYSHRREGGWTSGLQTQLLIFHLNEPPIRAAEVIGSTATAYVCPHVCVCFISELRAPFIFQ